MLSIGLSSFGQSIYGSISGGIQRVVSYNPNLRGLNYEELSFNALVGWIGHEFAHLIDYSSMNNRELLGFIAA